jgi:hypothetical protein
MQLKSCEDVSRLNQVLTWFFWLSILSGLLYLIFFHDVKNKPVAALPVAALPITVTQTQAPVNITITHPAPLPVVITNNINSNNVAPPMLRYVVKPRYTKIIKKTIVVHKHKRHIKRKHYHSCNYGCRYYTP